MIAAVRTKFASLRAEESNRFTRRGLRQLATDIFCLLVLMVWTLMVSATMIDNMSNVWGFQSATLAVIITLGNFLFVWQIFTRMRIGSKAELEASDRTIEMEPIGDVGIGSTTSYAPAE